MKSHIIDQKSLTNTYKWLKGLGKDKKRRKIGLGRVNYGYQNLRKKNKLMRNIGNEKLIEASKISSQSISFFSNAKYVKQQQLSIFDYTAL